MTFRRATPSDVPAIKQYLGTHARFAMFPLSNLETCGLDGDDPLSPRMWINKTGPLSDVLSMTKAGMILPYLPNGAYEDAAVAVSGRTVLGTIGPAAMARGMQKDLGLLDAATELDADETHFALDLNTLSIPDGDTQLVPLRADHERFVLPWMMHYHVSTLHMPPQNAETAVPIRFARDLEDGRRVILERDGAPVSTTAFNAVLPKIVQIGGVYTPPAHRGRGFARRAVALHLELARQSGVQEATLFANDPAALSAYQAIGFKKIGEWVLCILKAPAVAP